MVALTSAAAVMASTPTSEVIRTLLVSRKREGVFRRQMSMLEYVG